jgi:hypothetical protein
MREPVILRPGVLTVGPGTRRALGRHAGQGKRRTLDRWHDTGQRRTGLGRSLVLLLLLVGSRGDGLQPVSHRAQSAGLRPRLEDAIRRVCRERRTDKTSDEQADHEYPSLAEEVFPIHPA